MSSLVWRIVVMTVLVVYCHGEAAFAQARKPATKPKVAELCVSKIHVIVGCPACETMIAWLTQGGVKLNIKRVERGAYPTYPTVIYSDGLLDHGDRMYSQKVGIPKEIDVVSCVSVGG